jgi:dolichol-phosphate mannosyltransferase
MALRLRHSEVEVSIVVPALNEAENLPQLAALTEAAMTGTSYELLVIDDGSTDGTPSVCAELAQRYPIKLHVRPEPYAGLSGAVLEGFSRARGETLVVMDADLQHPPERLPALLAALDEQGVEVAVGSRYADGGTTASKWGLFRWMNSRVATLLAKPFAGGTRDPMSGFFALRRETFERAHRLTPLGYKIGLELMCKCRVSRVVEVPIHFGQRAGGESKLTVKQQFKYLEHLSRLYDFCFPRGASVVKFLIVTACAWLVGLGLYLGLLWTGANPMSAAVVSYPVALLATCVFHARYVRTQREFLPTRAPWRDFSVISLSEWAACALAAAWIAGRVREIHVLEVFALTYLAATVTRYVLRKELLQDIRGLRQDSAAVSHSIPDGAASKPAAVPSRKAA